MSGNHMRLITGATRRSPEDVIADIRISDKPKHDANRIAKELLAAHGQGQEDYFLKAEINLLALILLYVARAEMYVPLKRLPVLETPDSFHEQEMRLAADVVDLMCSDPEKLSDAIKQAIEKSSGDRGLMLHHYNAWQCSRDAGRIYSHLANEIELREFFEPEGEA